METIINDYINNNLVLNFNSSNTEGIFARLYSNAPFVITFMIESIQIAGARGRSFESFVFQHNINMNNPIGDNSFTIIRETNNIKDLNVGIKKYNNKYYLYTSKFNGVAFIVFIDQGRGNENIKAINNNDIETGDYIVVASQNYNKYIVNSDTKLQNVEVGSIFYDETEQNIKFNRYGIINYNPNEGYWFYPEEKHIRGEYKAGTIISISYIPNNNVSSIIIRNTNNYNIPEGNILNISNRRYVNESEYVYQVYALLHNKTININNIKLYRNDTHVYLQLLEDCYIYGDRAYQITELPDNANIEIPIICTMGSTDKRPNPYNWSPLFNFIGFQYFDTTLNKPIWWNGTQWIDSEGNDLDSTPVTSGTFANKPIGVNVGYAYFCTDKQTTEGTTNGIMIYYKGDNVWVDALGRVIS